MVDLQGKDKRNISLPMKLQSYEYEQAINKPTIINTQRTFYNIRIADIDNRINRLKDRNEKLLKEIENTDELVITLDAETADEIATLTKQVNTQNSRIENLKNNINKIEKDRTQVKETHRDNIKLFKERYTKKKIELVYQIKILSAKINSLENFKKVQNILQEKLEGNKERMIKYEKELKETTEGIRRKFEFDKEMLKIELYNYLLDLAAHFQIETNKFMSFPNKRLMQENIMLQKNLLQLSKEVSTKRNVAIDCQNIFESHRKTIVAQRSSTKHNMVTLKIYNRVLKALQRKFDKMKKCLSIINIPESTAEERQWLAVENARIEEQNVKFLLSSMQTLFHKEKTKIGIAKYLQRKVECKIKAVIETLYDVKYIVICLLKVF
ncbi:uncharacterized protein LOC116430727 [Nomia melanderi]|uniref:uncharacterized protein LOC116430727 n=1 Tax=Nomia melanderi TaxID=2448451 RepID=UPI003FCC2ACC